MPPKQALKFLIKEHVKQLLEAPPAIRGADGKLRWPTPEELAAIRNLDARSEDVAPGRWPTPEELAAMASASKIPLPGASGSPHKRLTNSASVAPKTVSAADRAKAEQDERNERDDEIIDRAIAYYNTGAGGWDGREAARLAGEMTAKQKLRKGSELERAENNYRKEEAKRAKDDKLKQRQADYGAQQKWNREQGINGGGSNW